MFQKTVSEVKLDLLLSEGLDLIWVDEPNVSENTLSALEAFTLP